jgi:hypothetical protein
VSKKLKFKNSILCEYVAKGDRNKHTLVNVYSGDVIVGHFPANLHFALYFELLVDKPGDQQVTLHFSTNNEKMAELSGRINTKKAGDIANIVIQAMPIIFDKETLFEVYASAESYAKTKVLSKKIFLGEFPSAASASQPPSELSPPDAPAS